MQQERKTKKRQKGNRFSNDPKETKEPKEIIIPKDWISKENLTIPVMLKILKDHCLKHVSRTDGKEKLKNEISLLKQVMTLLLISLFASVLFGICPTHAMFIRSCHLQERYSNGAHEDEHDGERQHGTPDDSDATSSDH